MHVEKSSIYIPKMWKKQKTISKQEPFDGGGVGCLSDWLTDLPPVSSGGRASGEGV